MMHSPSPDLNGSCLARCKKLQVANAGNATKEDYDA